MTGYVSVPGPFGTVGLTHWLVTAGSVARKLYKTFEPIGEDALAILEDLPWE